MGVFQAGAAEAASENYTLQYEKGGREYFDQATYDSYKKNYQLPALPAGAVIPLKVKGYLLNYRLFTQKNLVVYGNYNSVPGNYFKCGYQIHENLNEKQPEIHYDGGYFLKPEGVVCRGREQNPGTHGGSCKTDRGEWKYLGCDVNGNSFSNMWMINVATETTFKERNWIKEPWSKANEVKKELSGRISTYNEAAYNVDNSYARALAQGTKNWIYQTFKKYGGIPNNGKPYDPNVYQYLYIQSAPTIQKSGSGRMWHVRENGSIWYQTFSVPTLAQTKEGVAVKTDLPVRCSVSAVSKMPDIPEGSELDKQTVKLEFEVSGQLLDHVIRKEDEPAPEGWVEYYKDPIARTVYYTRQDIKDWQLNIEGITGLTLTEAEKKAKTVNTAGNTGKAAFTVEATVAEIKKLPKVGDSYKIQVYAAARVNYPDSHSQSAKGENSFLTGIIKKPPQPEKEPVVIDIPNISIQNSIGEIAFDGVPFTDAGDNTDMSAVSGTELYINGQAADYEAFFSGRYVFPETTDKNGYFAEVICKYNLDKSKISLSGLSGEQKAAIMSAAPLQYVSCDYVYVYPTKPNAQFLISSNTWKQNRIINVRNNSEEGNISLVLEKYPITEYRWSYGGDTSKLNKGTDTDMLKQLQYKAPGTYSVTLECKNTLGKWSDPYTIEFPVFEDISPNIELNLTDSILTRNDELAAWHYGINSTDGDRVAIAGIELWYDSDNDKKPDTKIQEWNGLGDNGVCETDDFPKYTPTQLGYYKYVIYAKDEFVGVAGQDTLVQYIADTDKKEEIYEVEFWVDNYQPLSDLYIAAEIERPNVDLYIMGDKGLLQEDLTYLSENRVSIENFLLGRNILPEVNIWNMKTYEYSTPANTSINSGKSYPEKEIPYTSSGYSGTLKLTSVIDNGGNHDFGHTETKTETKTASAGGRSVSGTGISDRKPPSSISYNSDGYSGTLSGYGYSYSSYNDPETGTFHWTRSYAGYSGTVSKTVSYWVPDIRWVSNYTGYYSGTIYKYVRQPYTDPWRATSSKYILYISSGTISELEDFKNAASKADAKIILAGTEDIKKQASGYSLYIAAGGKTIQQILNEALEYIASETPSIEQVYVLQNQSFTLNYGESDLENDTITAKEMQYVQDKSYFDNPTGQEPDTLTAPDSTEGWTSADRTSFSNVGKYKIYRRVKDLPEGAYGKEYSYYSGATEIDIYVHRKPIADAVLDWTYDTGTGECKTVWIDRSYDLDHNITRANTDKGIVERKIMFRKDSGEWQYYIPDTLTYGSYEVKYYVRDMEGAWSDPWLYSFTLDESPQFTAQARSKDNSFSLKSIPASEEIEAYNLWTRQPGEVKLEMSLTPDINGLPSTKTVYFKENVTGKQKGQDIDWFSQTLQIPDIFPDGERTFTIRARDIKTGVSTPKTFSVNVYTPINLQPNLGGKTINTGVAAQITARTTKYPVKATVIMQYGTAYQSGTISMNGTVIETGAYGQKAWTVNYTPPGSIPDGTYTARFTAENPSGKAETKEVTYRLVKNRPPVAAIKSIEPKVIYEGDTAAITFEVTDPDTDQILTSKITVKRGTETIYTGENITNVSDGEKKTFTIQTKRLTETGTYTVTITTADQHSESDTAAAIFKVNELSINGYVSHTATWKANWEKYNSHLTQSKKQAYGADTFFTGEKYILGADTTGIAPGSEVTAAKVSVKLAERTYSPVWLSKQGQNSFTGEMWNEDMRRTRWRGTCATFLFSVTYSNGTVKTDSVETFIAEYDYWRIRMAF
nr:transcriptional regulator [Ruminiclostridium sufflavum]